MQLQTSTIKLSKNEGKKIILDYFTSQKRTGLFAGLIGLISLIAGIIIFSNLNDHYYFATVLFLFGVIKSIIYFSSFFVMKTKISINMELYDLDPNSFLIEQKIQMKKTETFFRSLILVLFFSILIFTLLLFVCPLDIRTTGVIVALTIHAFFACITLYYLYSVAKNYQKKLGDTK